MLVKLTTGEFLYIVEETGDVFLATQNEAGDIVLNRGDVEDGEYETPEGIVLVVEGNKLVKIIEPPKPDNVAVATNEDSAPVMESNKNCKCGQGTKKVQELEVLVNNLTQKLEALEEENKKLQTQLETFKLKNKLNFTADKPKSLDESILEEAKKILKGNKLN